jgi:tRNA nucleotidyltransferase (CCA-adding enzyme)
MHQALDVCPPQATVTQALALLRRRRLRLLVTREGNRAGVVLPADLKRARALGLESRQARDVARWGSPVVTPRESEVGVRRLLLEGAPAVLVREGRRIVGAVEASIPPAAPPAISLLPRLERELPGPTLDCLRRIGASAEAIGARAYAVGGIVRDLLLGRRTSELGAGPRVDIATARRERYRVPGALPIVAPASIEEDLLRRDFSVNAMAVVLAPRGFGDLLDPLRGAADLARRRLRVLHPLSFVEDPTRIFRAVRYQSRLGLTLEPGSRRALRLAIALAPYPALSGQRLAAELELILAEPAGPLSLIALGRLGTIRLLDPAYRFSGLAARRAADLGRLLERLRRHAIAFDALPLGLLALLGHSPPEVAQRCLKRLALSGEPLARLTAGLRDGPSLAGQLRRERTAPASARASLMRGRPLESLAGAWLAGGATARRQVEWFLVEGRTVHPLLSGEDLLALGAQRGPRIRDLLDRLRDCRLVGAATTREEELALARHWIGAAERPETRSS